MDALLTKEQRYALAVACMNKRDGGGEVCLSECNVCGHIEWVSTDNSRAPGYVIHPIQSMQCHHCQDVIRRAPELAAWVFDVVAKAQRDVKS